MHNRCKDMRDEIWDRYEGADVTVIEELGFDMIEGTVVGQEKSGKLLISSTDGWSHGHNGNGRNIRDFIILSVHKSYYIDDEYLTIINKDFIKF